MARSLTFTYAQKSFECTIQKVDRARLYGSVTIETLDMEGEKCSLATLLDDGKTLVPNGGTASGYINPDGEWVCRKDITPVDFDGNELEKVPSSFDAPLELEEKASVEEFLDSSIRLTYALQSEEGIDAAFLEAIKAGSIFKTSFSYRGGIDPDPAFLMLGEDDTVWFLIGERNKVEYSALEQAAIVAATEEEDDEGSDEDDDELDFGML
ncbi:MAG: hypothetical protein V3V12_03875 [Gammaproteobacteria bacterium]